MFVERRRGKDESRGRKFEKRESSDVGGVVEPGEGGGSNVGAEGQGF